MIYFGFQHFNQTYHFLRILQASKKCIRFVCRFQSLLPGFSLFLWENVWQMFMYFCEVHIFLVRIKNIWILCTQFKALA